MSRKKELGRRRFLALTAGVGVAGISGCTSTSSENSEDNKKGQNEEGDKNNSQKEKNEKQSDDRKDSQNKDGEGTDTTGGEGDGSNDGDSNRDGGKNRKKKLEEKKVDEKSEVENPWRMHGCGPLKKGYSQTEPVKAMDLGKFWRHYVQGPYTLPEPVVAGDSLYLGSSKNLYALNIHNGKERWVNKLGKYTHNFSPAIGNDKVYVGVRSVEGANESVDEEGALFALDSKTGESKWSYDTHITSSPTLSNNKIYFSNSSSEKGYVASLKQDGTEMWKKSLGCKGAFSSPAVVNGRVYVTSKCGKKGYIHALDSKTGKEIWSYETAGIESAPIATQKGNVYVGDTSGGFHAVSEKGETLWKHSNSTGIYMKPLGAKGKVLFIADGKLKALTKTSGEIEWETKVGDVRRTGMAAADGTVYVGGRPLSVINLSDGSIDRHIPVDGWGGAYGAPSVADGVVYVGSCIKEDQSAMYDNYIYAIG